MSEKAKCDEYQYAVLSKDSVLSISQTCSQSELSDETLGMMAEDVSYRLRQLVKNGVQFMRHCKRRKLSCEDLCKSLKLLNVPPVYGYGVKGDYQPLVKVKDEDMYVIRNSPVNLAEVLDSPLPSMSCPHPKVSGKWINLEGTDLALKMHDMKAIEPLCNELSTYYKDISGAILGTDTKLLKVAIGDLQSNRKIAQLLPYFINVINEGVNVANGDVGILKQLLYMIHALVNNSIFVFESVPYMNIVINFVVYCLCGSHDATAGPLDDHWSLRDYAANLLLQMVRLWATIANNVETTVVTNLQDRLRNPCQVPCSMYGSIKALTLLGYQYIEASLPDILDYLNKFDVESTDSPADHESLLHEHWRVRGAIVSAAQTLLRVKTEEVSSSHELLKPNGPHLDMPSKYSKLYDILGESLIMRLPEVNISSISQSKTSFVRLEDEFSNKSGEEMLRNFMQTDNLEFCESNTRSANLRSLLIRSKPKWSTKLDHIESSSGQSVNQHDADNSVGCDITSKFTKDSSWVDRSKAVKRKSWSSVELISGEYHNYLQVDRLSEGTSRLPVDTTESCDLHSGTSSHEVKPHAKYVKLKSTK